MPCDDHVAQVIQEILCFVRIAWTIKYTCVSTKKEGVGIDPALVQKRYATTNCLYQLLDCIVSDDNSVLPETNLVIL